MLFDKIKELCAKENISIFALEKTLGLGNGTISRWNTSSPRLESIRLVANYFGVSVDELAGNPIQSEPSR